MVYVLQAIAIIDMNGPPSLQPCLVFIRLRQNTLRLAAGMNGEVNRAEAHQSEGGLAMAQFRLIPHRLRWGASLP